MYQNSLCKVMILITRYAMDVPREQISLIDDAVVLSCDAMHIRGFIPTFPGNILLHLQPSRWRPYVPFYKAVVSTYESTWRHNPEEHRHSHRLENLKCLRVVFVTT